jgi:hypothetical protein
MPNLRVLQALLGWAHLGLKQVPGRPRTSAYSRVSPQIAAVLNVQICTLRARLPRTPAFSVARISHIGVRV